MANEEENKEDSVYDEEDREKLVEEGEMSPEEAGFMKGYDEADKEKKVKKKEAKPESKEVQKEKEKLEETLSELDTQKENKQ
ncbi:MAG TPA: hypothetical protein EYO56_06070 [Gammaproteobacteria bacterium]|nr:hypothetical protein [Gammaproteobacteria bacterium]